MSNNPFAYLPPQDIKVEESLIGVLLLEKDRLIDVMQVIPGEEAFYEPRMRTIYGTMVSMYHQGKLTDLLTVNNELREQGKLEQIGGTYELTVLTQSVVSSAHVIPWAKIVVKMYMLRETIRISGVMTKEAYDLRDPEEIQDMFVSQMNKAFDAKSQQVWISSEVAARKYLKQREEILSNKGAIGISTTIPRLDAVNSGLRPGQFVVIAARPSVGKSALAGSIALTAAKNGEPGGVINLEMPIEDVFGREISQDSGIDYSEVDRGNTLQAEFLMGYVESLAKLPIWFADTTTMNINDIRRAAAYLKKKYGIKWLIIDYLQLVSATDKNKGNREQAVAEVSRGLKLLAMSLRIPVIALSQLNRESEKRTNKVPTMADIRETGAIEQDADIIMILHRDWRVGILKDQQGNSTEFQADLIIPKWRNGTPVDVKLNFHPSTMRFSQRDNDSFNLLDAQGISRTFKQLPDQPETKEDLPF